MRNFPALRATAVCSSLALAACGSGPRAPAIGEIYQQAALREARNPVVVIHGILGARLEQRSTGQIVWGAFTADGIDVETPEGVRALAVPLPGPEGAMAYDPALADVYPSGPLEKLEIGLLFNVISVDVYLGILQALGVGGFTDRVYADPQLPAYAEDHFTCHTFFYDWRRDNVENAIAFGRFLREKRLEIDASANRKIAKLRAEDTTESRRHADELAQWLQQGYRFDVVAHSMGGLLARYYLRYGEQDLPADGSVPEVTWAGAEEIDRMILIGTPSLGSVQGFNRLISGFRPAFFLPRYHPAVLGTMPSIYQLMPRNTNHVALDRFGEPLDVDLFDPEVWERNEWGLMNPESAKTLEWLQPDVADPVERRRRAKSYLAWCLGRAAQFFGALDKDAELPCPAEIRLFAADTLDTPGRFALLEHEGKLTPYFDGKDSMVFGDDTVPRYSALADRRFGNNTATWLDSPVPWSSVTFLPDDHVGLTKNPLFTDNLLFFLLEQKPRRTPPGPRAVATSRPSRN